MSSTVRFDSIPFNNSSLSQGFYPSMSIPNDSVWGTTVKEAPVDTCTVSSTNTNKTLSQEALQEVYSKLTPEEKNALVKAYQEMQANRTSLKKDFAEQSMTIGSTYAFSAVSGTYKYCKKKLGFGTTTSTELPTSQTVAPENGATNTVSTSTSSNASRKVKRKKRRSESKGKYRLKPQNKKTLRSRSKTPKELPTSQTVAPANGATNTASTPISQNDVLNQGTSNTTSSKVNGKKSRFKKCRQYARITSRKCSRKVKKGFAYIGKPISNANAQYFGMTNAAKNGTSFNMTTRNWYFKPVTATYQFAGSSAASAGGGAASTAQTATTIGNAANTATKTVKVGKTATSIVKGCGSLTKAASAGTVGCMTALSVAIEDMGDITYAYKYGKKGDGLKQTGQTAVKAGAAGVGAWAGAKAGLAAGAKIGAAIGSIFPGAGTAIGMGIGAAVGFIGGGLLGGILGKRTAQKAVGKDVGERLQVEALTNDPETQKEAEALVLSAMELKSYDGFNALCQNDANLRSAMEKIAKG